MLCLGVSTEQHRGSPGLLAISLLVPVPQQEFGSECEAWTHSLLLDDLRVEQAKICSRLEHVAILI